MTTQQAQQLAAEAEALVERLTAAREEAFASGNIGRANRAGALLYGALVRFCRRRHAWSVAAYGPGEVA